MRSQDLSALDTRITEYIDSSPEKVWSGSMRAYHKIYRKYLQVSRIEYFNAKINKIDEDVLFKKRILMRQLYQIKKALHTSEVRNRQRSSYDYITRKRDIFWAKINKL